MVAGVILVGLSGCKSDTGSARQNEAGSAVRRVVTLTPSATEIVVAVGGADRLVAVDRYSDYPPEVVARLPRVGDFLTPNIEAIVALQPDLVVMDELQSKTVDALAAANIRSLVLPMHALADVRRAIGELGQALGTEPVARDLLAAIDRDIAEVSARARTRAAPRPRALLIVDRELGGLGNMVAAGPGTFLDELARTIGADNALAGATARYPKVSPEQVLEAQPTVIFDAVHTNNSARARRDWDGLAVPAVTTGKVFVLSDRLFVSPGPRLGEALRRLEKLVYE